MSAGGKCGQTPSPRPTVTIPVFYTAGHILHHWPEILRALSRSFLGSFLDPPPADKSSESPTLAVGIVSLGLPAREPVSRRTTSGATSAEFAPRFGPRLRKRPPNDLRDKPGGFLGLLNLSIVRKIRVAFRSAKDAKDATFAERKATVIDRAMLTCSFYPAHRPAPTAGGRAARWRLALRRAGSNGGARCVQ